MTTSPETLLLLIRQQKFQDAYTLAKKYHEENPNDIRTLLVLSYVSPQPLEKACWAYKARQLDRQNPHVEKAWESLPPISLDALARQAGQVNWHIRQINLPIEQAVAEKKVTFKDLSWAAYKLQQNRLLRWAAATYVARLQNKLEGAITPTQAFGCLWPFKQINLPIEQALHGVKIDFGDLCYGILNGRGDLPAAAVTVGAILLFEEILLCTEPQPTRDIPPQVTVNASPAPAPVSGKQTRPQSTDGKTSAVPTPAAPQVGKSAVPATQPSQPNDRSVRPDGARPAAAPSSKTSAAAGKTRRLTIVGGSHYLKEQLKRAQEKKRRWQNLWGIVLVLLFLCMISSVISINNWYIVVCLIGIVLGTGLIIIYPLDRIQKEIQNYKTGIAGEQKALQTLEKLLDERWTLFTNVDLPDKKGDIDGVLVGPSGLYVLEIKAFSGKYRNHGLNWQYRSRFSGWKQADRNPSAQARANAQRLHDFLLRTAELDQWVEPRVFWTGEYLQIEQPAVPIWLLRSPDRIAKDLQQGRPIADERLQQLRIILKSYTVGYHYPGS